ncbi:periplasmic binding protein/LacI transcriptional regulator, partial [Pseudomonas syringae pv. pisi str. 1704B]
PAELAIESLRSLRTSLHFAMLEARNNVLMISSPTPGAGKSFVSSNLATIIAQTGKRLALVQVNQQALYFTQITQGAQAAAKAAGAELVVFNANDNPSAQNDAIEAYIQDKVDAILVCAIDVNGIKPAVTAAA